MITKYSPGNLVFARYMIFHKQVRIDWGLIQSRRRAQQIRDNTCDDRSRTNDKYIIRDKVIIITTARESEGNIFGLQCGRPYNITVVHNNINITIRC